MSTPVEIHTARLLLRQWRSSDYEEFRRINANARVMEFFLAPLTSEESDRFAVRLESLIEERGWGLWALEETATGKFIGFTGLHVPSIEFPFTPCVEIGWRLDSHRWGRGYATEAAGAALR